MKNRGFIPLVVVFVFAAALLAGAVIGQTYDRLAHQQGPRSGSGGDTVLAAGTVTSVDVSGGTTGLTTSGGPVTGAGTITIAGTLGTGNGGSGIASVADGALLMGGVGGGTANLATLATSTGGFLSYSYSTGRPTVTATSTLNLTFNNILGTLGIASGGTNQTSFPLGNIWYNGSSISGTSSIFTVGSIIATTTSTSTYAGPITIKSVIVPSYKSPGFQYSTTTAWTGSTTLPLPSPVVNDKLDALLCYTDAGTLQIQVGNYTASTTMFQASTTEGIESFSSNNTFNAATKWYIQFGSPASSPTVLTCTFKKENTQ